MFRAGRPALYKVVNRQCDARTWPGPGWRAGAQHALGQRGAHEGSARPNL